MQIPWSFELRMMNLKDTRNLKQKNKTWFNKQFSDCLVGYPLNYTKFIKTWGLVAAISFIFAFPVYALENPLTLVWLVVEKDNKMQWLNMEQSGTELAMAQDMEKIFKEDNISIMYPLLDLTDTTQISEYTLQKETLEPLQENAKRYNADAVLIGRLTPSALGWKGHWTFIKGGVKHTWDITKPDSNLMFHEIANNLKSLVQPTNAVSTNTNTKLPSEGVLSEKTQFFIMVSDITSSEDYEKALAYLQQLPNVAAVEISQIMSDKVIFSVESKVNAETIAKAISEGQTLVAIPTETQASEHPLENANINAGAHSNANENTNMNTNTNSDPNLIQSGTNTNASNTNIAKTLNFKMAPAGAPL